MEKTSPRSVAIIKNTIYAEFYVYALNIILLDLLPYQVWFLISLEQRICLEWYPIVPSSVLCMVDWMFWTVRWRRMLRRGLVDSRFRKWAGFGEEMNLGEECFALGLIILGCNSNCLLYYIIKTHSMMFVLKLT